MRCGPLVGRAGKAGGCDVVVTVVGGGVAACPAGLCALVPGFVVFGVDGVVGDARWIGGALAMPGWDTGGFVGAGGGGAPAPECVAGVASCGPGTPHVCAVESVECCTGSCQAP